MRAISDYDPTIFYHSMPMDASHELVCCRDRASTPHELYQFLPAVPTSWLRHMLEDLNTIKTFGPIDAKQGGICVQLGMIMRVRYATVDKDEISKYMKYNPVVGVCIMAYGWPQHSGRMLHPVDTDPAFSPWGGPNGERRRDLLNFVIEATKKEIFARYDKERIRPAVEVLEIVDNKSGTRVTNKEAAIEIGACLKDVPSDTLIEFVEILTNFEPVEPSMGICYNVDKQFERKRSIEFEINGYSLCTIFGALWPGRKGSFAYFIGDDDELYRGHGWRWERAPGQRRAEFIKFARITAETELLRRLHTSFKD